MKTFFSILLVTTGFYGQAQTILVPGENVLDKKWIKNGTYEMACYAVSGGQQVEFSSFTIQVNASNKTLAVYTSFQMTGSNDITVDTSISDGNTFKPIYRSSFSKSKDMVLHYGKEVTGYYYDKQTKKRQSVKDAVNNAFFDSYTYPYLLGSLPLTSGYKSDMAVYDYKPGNQTNTKKARIEEVKSNMYVSSLTGEHKVWQVNVFEEATKDSYAYFIDKDSRRLWKVEVLTQGQRILMVDKEIDYNPFTTKFNKEQTLKMVQSGNSVVLGQAFARDNQNEGMLKGIAVLNINKKQFAQSGTTVVLIPYTDYFKEWMKLNEASRKKGRAIPLPKEATECIKVTTVYDNEGHFEFTNLMPGEYLLYSEFGYVHTSIRSEVTGYSDRYINGLYQGTYTHTTTKAYNGNAAASVKKTITIKTNGEKVSVKLKKTL
ncbi:MAG TPA: hypothetical protein VF008_28255 [Niastella sp.]